MADDKKEKTKRYVTPKGTAMYPWLNKADTKFKAAGEYRLGLRLSPEAAQPMIDMLQPMWDAAVAAAKKNPKNKGKKYPTFDFYKQALDADGNETGEIEFSFKRMASGISTKTKEPWAIKPDLFDSAGNKLSPEAKVFGGSIVKVSYSVSPYDKPIGNGISLRLEAVKVIKLVEGNRDQGQYGFGDDSEDEDSDTPSGDGDGGDAPADGKTADEF